MLCNKCGFEGNPNLEETGPHTKAVCSECGAYIKMVGKSELDTLVNASLDELPVIPVNGFPIEEEKQALTLVVKTEAPIDYMPNVLSKVKVALQQGYLSGEGVVSEPFDEGGFEYSFYYN